MLKDAEAQIPSRFRVAIMRITDRTVAMKSASKRLSWNPDRHKRDLNQTTAFREFRVKAI